MGSQDVDHLLAKLIQSAADAIRRERDGLAFDQHRLRGLTLEFEIMPNGVVSPARVYCERSAKRDGRESPK